MSLARGLAVSALSVFLTVLLSLSFHLNFIEYYDEYGKVVFPNGVQDNDSPQRSNIELDYMMGNGAPPSTTISIEMKDVIFEEFTYNNNLRIDPQIILRPKKTPKGEIWRGWSKSSSVLPRNVGNASQWWRNSKNCFEVDQICHAVHGNEWFYYSMPDDYKEHPQQQKLEHTTHTVVFQPTMELKSAPAKYDGGRDRGDSRISIQVSSSSKLLLHHDDDEGDTIEFDTHGRAFRRNSSNHNDFMQCQISSTSTHIVLQSLFNDMIGEFYSRTLVKLYRLMMQGIKNQENSSLQTMPWEEVTQFYAHIAYGNKQMLDGHKLLLSGMMSHPDTPLAKSFVDMFLEEKMMAAEEEDREDCECYQKMVFCGYDIYTHDVNVFSKDLPSKDIDRGDNMQHDNEEDILASNQHYDYDLKYTLWSSTLLDEHVEVGCTRSASGKESDCQEWYGLRNFLGENFMRRYPTLIEDIFQQRRRTLLARGTIDNEYSGDTTEFTFIGLTQRTYRRSWINLPDIIENCTAAFVNKVICIEVNVENMSSPFEQLVMHRSLDVMIGVHGAQLTQAVLLPTHGHVLELLPWVPDYIRGHWVQTTNHPTPLGVIFHNTDLNHLGYSLDRSSVPLCQNVTEENEQPCFMKQRKNFLWENRDFVVDSEVILQFIENFVMFGHDRKRTCDEMKATLNDRFVLYNIWCINPHEQQNNATLSLLHNYHKLELIRAPNKSSRPKRNAKGKKKRAR